MWRSTLTLARRFRSPQFQHSTSDFRHFHSKVLHPQPLPSYLHHFRSISSTSTDSITDRNETDSFNMNDMWNDSIREVNSVLEPEVAVNDNANAHAHEVDIDDNELDRVISVLKTTVNDFNFNDMNLNLSEEFVVRVLEAENVPVENLVEFFKWTVKSSNQEVFSVTARSLDALVRAVSKKLKKKVAYDVWDLVKEIGEKEKDNGVVTTEALNMLISLFSRLGKGLAGYEVFSKFGDFGCATNADSYYFTIEGLCRRSILDRVGLVCESMVSEGKLPECEKVGGIVYHLCKAGMVKEAYSVYLLAKGKERYPPRSSVNFLITCLCDRKKNDAESVHFALKMLEDLEDKKHAIKQFSCVMQGLCRVNDIDAAKKLLNEMMVNGPPPGNAVFNTVINACSKGGDLAEGVKVMRMMENRGLKPDVFAYSVIMSGYMKGGEIEEAVKMLAEAKKNHSKLTPVIYHTIISGYCRVERFEEAVKLLEEMEEYGVRASTDEYMKLIQSLCLKAADWVMAEKLLEEMTKKGLRLNGITKSLIKAVKELEEEAKETKEVSVEA